MQNTSNYNLNIVEGTDLVNPPIQFNPNFQTIDSAMFANKEKTIGTASEVVTGTVHAVVRANQDADAFRFTATGAWTTGDTMTVDGTAVTVHLSDGTAPLTGAYVIGAEVLAVLNGTLVTLITSSAAIDPGVTSFNTRTGAVTPAASDYDASMIDYDNTLSGLTSTDVQSAIDEIASSSPSGLVEYSLTERVIGTWVDGSTLYEKTVDCGQLPAAAGSKTVPHGISNINRICLIEGTTTRANRAALPVNYAYPGNVNYAIQTIANDTNIIISVGADSSEDIYTYVTLRYTKTI